MNAKNRLQFTKKKMFLHSHIMSTNLLSYNEYKYLLMHVLALEVLPMQIFHCMNILLFGMFLDQKFSKNVEDFTDQHNGLGICIFLINLNS